MAETFFPGLFASRLCPVDVMVQASMAVPLCHKILEGRLTIVTPSWVTTGLQDEAVVEEDEESLFNSRLSPIPLEFDPWLNPSRAVRLSGVPPDTPLALIKASLRGEGVPFRWVSWSAVPGEALVEARGSEARRVLLRRGLVLCGGGPRLRARAANNEELSQDPRSASAPGLLEATRCAQSFPDACGCLLETPRKRKDFTRKAAYFP